MRPSLRPFAALAAALALSGCALAAGRSPDPTPASPDGARGERGGDGPAPYASVIPGDALTRQGLLTAQRVGDDLFFEVPDSVLGREMLLLGRAVASTTQSQAGFFGGGPRLIVQWERDGERVVLREKVYDARADTAAAIWGQVAGMRRGPVLAAFEVEAWAPDGAAVVEVTDLFTGTNRPLGSLEGVDAERSWIEHVAAFPRNVEVEATQTGRPPSRNGPGGGPGGNGGDGPELATQRMHWSLVLLPDDPMMPRLEDARVGYISSEHTAYDTDEHGSRERSFIHRFRLEPSDTAAFRRGEPVPPVEPITYWIDPATPDWLKPWVARGVEAWNEAFREAGFRDAIRGEVAPVSDDWSLYDARHSVIYWRPSTVANATGGQVVDPRSGEILKGEVNMYHNVQNLLRDWYFTQVAPLDSRARSLPLPDSLMGRLVEYVVTHEVGHSIGFPHNMKASAMYPPDSLRSESFLRRMGGHVATLMDYSRFNYVAQPGDGIPPELLVPRIGPYDRFAIEWGYRPILDARTPEEERATLDRLARRQDTIPWLRFTTDDSPNDPYDLTEAVGDADAVASSTLGLLNLQRVMDMLIDVAERPGQDYGLLDDLYGSAVSQWSRYMGHVAAVVGGAETQERYGTGVRFTPLPRARQEEAVRFLNARAFATPAMLIDPAVLRRIEAAGIVPRIRAAQRRVLATLLDDSRLNRMEEYEALAGPGGDMYGVADLAEDVRGGVWGELDARAVGVDVYRRNLQRAYLEVVDEALNPPESEPPSPFGPPREAGYASDVRPVLRGELRELDRRAERALPRAADRMTRLHLDDVRAEIARILDPGG